MAQDTYGARKFLFDTLMHERSLDREAIRECDKMRIAGKQTLSEVLVSEGVVTDQEMGHLLDKFADEGHISPAELTLLTNEFSSSWERWKEMEERDAEIVAKTGIEEAPETEEPETVPEEAVIESLSGAAGPGDESEDEKADVIKARPLTERVHRGSLQEALEGIMEGAPVKEYPAIKTRPVEKAVEVDPFVGTSLGGAKITKKIGTGEFGTVYKGVIDDLGIAVAVRVISTDAVDEPRRQQILKKAKDAARIEHRNVAEIVASGEGQDNIYVISKFVDGETLRSRLEKTPTLDQVESLEVALQVARAIRACHDKEVYHGDLKPENIFFDKEDKVVLTGFGLAKSAEIQKNTGSKQALFMGSPQYMAPEQFEAKPPDARTDIYALGIVLFEMLTAKLPFEGPTAFAIRDAHMKGEPKLVTEIDPRLNPTVAKLAGKMMKKELDERYQSMTELVNDMIDLKQHLDTGSPEPTIIPPGTPGTSNVTPDVRARAQKYKTVAIIPEGDKKSRIKGRHVVILLILLAAIGGGAYTFIMKPDLFKLQENFEEKAANAYQELKRKADIILSQQKYFATLQELDKFPAEYSASQARRDLETYRDSVFDQADKTFEQTQKRIDDMLKEERFEAAKLPGRAFRVSIEQIVTIYGERWPKAALLKKYLDPARENEEIIGKMLDMVRNFEVDIKLAESYLEKDEIGKAQEIISKYLVEKPTNGKTGNGEGSTIAKYRAKAMELKERIDNRNKDLKDAADKKREMVEYYAAVEAAKKDLENGNYQKARGSILKFKKAKQQWIVDDVKPLLAEINEKIQKEIETQKIKERGKQFKLHIAQGRKLIEDKKYKDVVDTVVGIYKKNGKYVDKLTEEQKAELKKLEEDANYYINFAEKLKEIEDLIAVNEFEKARRLCSMWRLNPREDIREAANRKYIKIMNSKEPGMIYVEGGSAVLGAHDVAELLIEKLDTNRDGRIAEAEFNGPHIKFREIDKKSDGSITKEDMEALVLLNDDDDEKISKKEFKGPDRIFRKIDTNRNGYIDKEEMVIEKFDSNNDGGIDPVEFAGYPDVFKDFDLDSDGVIIEKELQISSFDSDKDGGISRKEFVLAPELFDRLDKNSDGVITENDEDENPERTEIYRTFYMDQHEVTCEEYEKFVKAGNYAPPTNWPRGTLPRQWAQMPVTGITWDDATAYAAWAGKRLPTDTEWEIAASWNGKKKSPYPWGNTFKKGNANIATGEVAFVGSYPKDKSPSGLFDMGGNVAEWTASKIVNNPYVRGSSAEKKAQADSARTTRRSLLSPNTTSNFLGFRCAKDSD